MKLFILAFFLGLQLTGSAYGQDNHSRARSPFSVAINSGLTLSNLSSQGFNVREEPFGNLRFSFIGGAALEYRMLKNIYIRSGLHYAGLGGKSEEQIFTDTEGRELGRIRFVEEQNYVEIPLQLKFFFGNKKNRSWAGSGLTIGFLTSARQDLDSTVDGISSAVDEDISDIRNSTAVGFTFSAGQRLALRPDMGLDLGGTYYLGLNNLLKNAEEDQSLKLNSFRIVLGLYFKI